MGQSLIYRERLLNGNWKIRPAAGLLFRREWFETVEVAPADAQRVRFWDRAATEERPGTDPDWTAGVRMSRDSKGVYYIEGDARLRAAPLGVKRAIKNTAGQDGTDVTIGLEQEPGASGKFEVGERIRELAGYKVVARRPTGDKVTRAGPFSAQVEAGNVKIVRGDWNGVYLNVLENFPDGKHDDDVDASSGAFEMLARTSEPNIRMLA